jgi:hypothetical protein
MAPEDWIRQTRVTTPGSNPDVLAAIAALPADISSLRAASSELEFHYRAGDFAKAGVDPARRAEINTRFASTMLDRIMALSGGDKSLNRPRAGRERTVGCCRDAAVLFLALARAKGVACRARVGFASYIIAGWWMDHVVVEVWDPAAGEWFLVDPEMRADYRPTVAGKTVDWLRLRSADFLTGAAAWAAARRGEVDPERFVVAPALMEPILRGWRYLAHNVIHDLANVNRREMLLWDVWGVQNDLEAGVDDQVAGLLDEVAGILLRPEVTLEELAKLAENDGLRVPSKVFSADPLGGPGLEVDVPWVDSKV